MEKLTEVLKPLRISSTTKKGLQEMADKDYRELCVMVRMILDKAVKEWNEAKKTNG